MDHENPRLNHSASGNGGITSLRNMKPAPFLSSFEARRKIRAFAREAPDTDTVLTLLERGEMRDPTGKTTMLIDGAHFFLEHCGRGRLPEDSFYMLGGQPLSIARSVLEHLKGKRLIEKSRPFGPRHPLTLFFPRYQLNVLTTEPAPGEFIALEPDGLWHNRPVLDQNEAILDSLRTLMTNGQLIVSGRLYLTSTRLVFAPDRITNDAAIKGWQARRESLDKVILVEGTHRLRDFLSGAMRTRVAVKTVSGQTAHFRTDAPGEFMAGLAKYMTAGKAEPGHVFSRT